MGKVTDVFLAIEYFVLCLELNILNLKQVSTSPIKILKYIPLSKKLLLIVNKFKVLDVRESQWRILNLYRKYLLNTAVKY
jgi:hypothetical protein